MDWKQADLVQLASGGPEMTVEKVTGEHVACVWFDGKKVYRDVFDAALLRTPPKKTIGAVGLSR